MKVTVSFTNQAGNIPEYDLTEEELIEQLSLSDDKVYVCFFTDTVARSEQDYAEEHKSFLVTSCVVKSANYLFESEDLKAFDKSVFCFETYNEAFKYCIDLKDGTE
jgi:hypothetical protein